MGLELVKIIDKKGKKAFVNFPHDLYADDPNYVPEIFMGQMDILDEKKYPFFNYGTAELWLAYQDEKIVGRIASIDNTNYNQHFKTQTGFFGFFDCINDKTVAHALLDRAKSYANARGFNKIIGPTNYSTNETAGTLINGFNESPKIMMTYNASYYQSLLESFGLVKEIDLYAYLLPVESVSKKSLKLADAFEQRLERKGITIRKIRKKDIVKEAAGMKIIYNSAWEDNWGFVPFTDAEFEFLRNDLKMLVDEDFTFAAEKDGKMIGFGLTLPDINEILIKNKRGKLFPFGLFRLLFGKKKTNWVRVIALGVLPEYRKMGIEAIFFAKNIAEAKRRRIKGGEASWILESNTEMVNAAERMNGIRYKTYRLFSKPL